MKDDRVADQLVQMRAEVAAVRAMTYRNISHVARTGQPGPEASVIRLFTSELGQRLERMAVLLKGADILDFRYGGDDRSEEHTSELQSLMRISYAVFCLKKKKQ